MRLNNGDLKLPTAGEFGKPWAASWLNYVLFLVILMEPTLSLFFACHT
jgi:hypothetical protein